MENKLVQILRPPATTSTECASHPSKIFVNQRNCSLFTAGPYPIGASDGKPFKWKEHCKRVAKVPAGNIVMSGMLFDDDHS